MTRYFTPGPHHHRLGLVCLGVGLQHGGLPAVGPRTLDHHIALVIGSGSGRLRPPARRPGAGTRGPCGRAPAARRPPPGTRRASATGSYILQALARNAFLTLSIPSTPPGSA